MAKITNCEDCQYYIYDDEYDCFVCEMELDEDEMVHFLKGDMNSCSYFRLDDEYKVVRKQI